MSQLRKEITACMSNEEVTADGHMRATFRFPADFIGFRGHFPDKPILPGICKIQAIVALCEALKQKPIRLCEVSVAKFFTPAESGEDLVFDCSESDAGEGMSRIKAHVSRAGERIARIDLLIRYAA